MGEMKKKGPITVHGLFVGLVHLGCLGLGHTLMWGKV